VTEEPEDPHSRPPPSLELDGSSEPPAPPPRRPSPAVRRPLPQLPLWGRWVLSLCVGVALIVALILFVNAHNVDRPTADNTKVTAESNREARALIAEDQAPRVSPLKPRTAPALAITTVVTAYMRRMIGAGTIPGPLTRTHCSAAGASGRARRGFRCAAVAASVRYPFLGVVDQATRQVTYCKHDPLGPAGPVPVSPRCRA
jgi:hypothetical protein